MIPFDISRIIQTVFPWAHTTPDGYLDVSEHRGFGVQRSAYSGTEFLSYVNANTPHGEFNSPSEISITTMALPTLGIRSEVKTQIIGFVSYARGEWNDATFRSLLQGERRQLRGHTFEQLAPTAPPYDTPPLLRLQVNPAFQLRQIQKTPGDKWVWQWMRNGHNYDLGKWPWAFETIEDAVFAWRDKDH